jgi:hypothetical protein
MVQLKLSRVLSGDLMHMGISDLAFFKILKNHFFS